MFDIKHMLKQTPFKLIITSLFLFIGFIILQRFLTKSIITNEGYPKFLFGYIIASFGYILSSFLFVYSITAQEKTSTGSATPQLLKAATLVSLGLTVLSLLIFAMSYNLFHDFVKEDGIIENASAILFFISSALALILLFKTKADKIVLGLISLVFFVIGMEEISWMQRVLDIETPQSFSGNIQKEMNFHNFNTDLMEILYYGGAFVALVLAPFIHRNTAFFSSIFEKIKMARLNLFIPGYASLLAIAPAMGLNYDMWNIPFTQIALYLTVFILLFEASREPDRTNKFLYQATALTCIVTQIAFLILGHNQIRLWDVTELKEIYFPLACAVYVITLWQRLRGKAHMV